MRFTFTTRQTPHGCTVELETPKRRQVVRFRDGIVLGRTSAQNWIAAQVESLVEFAADADLPTPEIVIDGQPYSQPQRTACKSD
jgi:hypothetical protein